MKHGFDPRIQQETIVWHNDATLEKYIDHLITTVKPDRWVETGTHMGWTCAWLAEHYPGLPIYTAEIDEQYYRLSGENLAAFPQISRFHGRSIEFLERLVLLCARGVTAFWLDAHWQPPIPLRAECRLVASLARYVCLIDDFSCWEPDFPGDTYEGRLNDLSYTSDILGAHCYRPNYPANKPGFKGVATFLKDVDYVPPHNLMKPETMAVHEIHQRGLISLKGDA